MAAKTAPPAGEEAGRGHETAAVAQPRPQPPPAPPEAKPLAEGVRESCVTGVAAGDTLKVRAGPGVDQALRFGYLPGTCGIRITGACNDGWCPVDYRGYQGWAEQEFLK